MVDVEALRGQSGSVRAGRVGYHRAAGARRDRRRPPRGDRPPGRAHVLVTAARRGTRSFFAGGCASRARSCFASTARSRSHTPKRTERQGRSRRRSVIIRWRCWIDNTDELASLMLRAGDAGSEHRRGLSRCWPRPSPRSPSPTGASCWSPPTRPAPATTWSTGSSAREATPATGGSSPPSVPRQEPGSRFFG